MHGNRIGKNSRHPVPKGLDEVFYADPVHGQIAFRAKMQGLFRAITFAVTFDDTLGTQQRFAFGTMPMRFSSRMTAAFFFHVFIYREKDQDL